MTSQIRTQALLIAATNQSQDAINGLEEQKGSLLWVMQDLKAEIKDLAADIGSELLPMAKDMIQTARDWVSWFGRLDQDSKRLAITLGVVAAAIGPVTMAVAGLTRAVAVLLSPFALKIAAMFAFVAGLDYMRRNLDAFKLVFIDAWNSMVDGMIMSLQAAMRALNIFIRVLDPSRMGIEPIIASMESLKRGIPDREDGYGFQTLGEFISDIGSDMRRLLEWVSDKFFSFSADVVESTQQAKRAVSDMFINMPVFDLSGLAMPVRQMAVDVGEAAGAMDRAVQIAAQNITGYALEMGHMLQSVVASSITNFAETLGNAFTGDAGASGFFNNILMVVADFGKQLGRMLIASGVAALAFQRLLINPIGAIAAGTALIVAATAARNLLASGPGQSVNDALISNGRVVHLHPNDDVLAMKNFSNLGGGNRTAIINLKSVNEMDSRTIWEANRRYEVSL